MRNLEKYLKTCLGMLDELNIPYGKIHSIKANKTARSRWGQCKKTVNGYDININISLLDEQNSENGLIDTIIHEVLHTVDGCMNHGKKWNNLAEKVNRKYGLNISRCSSSNDKGVVKNLIPKRVYSHEYVCQCKACGNKWRRKKMSKLIEHPNWYRCPCGGTIERVA